MQKKKGISLIVLVITIIVMIVLAGAIILSLNNAGIIEKSNEAVDLTNLANAREFAQTKWAEAYLETDKTQEALETYVLDELAEVGITEENYEIVVTEKGVTVNKKGETKIITFKIAGVEYQAEEGMTWFEWANSSYNTSKYECETEGSYVEYYTDISGDEECYYVAPYMVGAIYMLEEGRQAATPSSRVSGRYKITADVSYIERSEDIF